jgi:hypothetical protein
LCKINETDNPNYGQWPDVSENALGDGMNFALSWQGSFNSGNWAYWAGPQGSGVSGAEKVCCNSKSGKCGKIDGENLCDASTVIK